VIVDPCSCFSIFRNEKIIKYFKINESNDQVDQGEVERDVEPPMILMMFRVIKIFSPNVLSPVFTLSSPVLDYFTILTDSPVKCSLDSSNILSLLVD